MSPSALRLLTLGDLRLEGADAPGPSSRRKELALLAYLARLAPRSISRGEAAALLWDERDDRRARQSLRQALTELRRIAGPALLAEGDRLAVKLGALTLDAAEMERAVSEGRHEEAVRLCGGDFLPGVEDVAGESFRGWLEAEREGLRRTVGHALERLVDGASTRGAWDDAVEWAKRWCVQSPTDERAHARCIDVLCLAGRAPEAAARHGSFVARLRADLGRDPSAEVHALEASIERNLRREQPRHQPGSAALFTPDLVGRESSLGELWAAWESARMGQPTVVLIEGDTGIGKTRTVEEFVRRVRDAATVTWVAASEIASGLGPVEAVLERLAGASGLAAAPAAALAAVAARVPAVRRRFPGLPEAADVVPFDAAASAAVAAVADERPLLVVLDDAEQIAPAAVARLAASAQAAAAAVLVVVAVGPGDIAGTQVDVATAIRRARRILLQPLTAPQVESLVASMLVLPPEARHTLATRLQDESGGNPLYVIELVAALVDDGILALGDRGTWTLVRPETWSFNVSGGLRSMVEHRTRGLSPDAWDVAGAVARLQPAATEPACRDAAGLSADRFDAGRDELIARRLIRTAPLAGGGFRFYHQVVRRAVLERAERREAEARRRSHRRRIATAAGLAALLLGGLLARERLVARDAPDAATQRRVLVAPVQSSGDLSPQDSAVIRALGDALERSLATRSLPAHVIRFTLARMRRADTLRPTDHPSAREVALRSGVSLLLVPEFERAAGRQVLSYRIESAATGETVSSREQDAPATGAGTDQIAALARAADGDVTGAAHAVSPIQALPNVTTSSYEALQAYVSGDRLSSTGDDAGRVMLRRAIELDTAFAAAQARLAFYAWFDYDQREAERNAKAVLPRLGSLPAAERIKARLDVANAMEDWPAAIANSRSFIELDPGNGLAWHGLAQLLYFDRQFAAAVDTYDSARVRMTGPTVSWLVNRATVLTRLNRIVEAVRQYEEAFTLHPPTLRHPGVNHEYGAALARLGRDADARGVFATRLTGTPEDRAGGLRSLALLDAHNGRMARARQLLDDATAASASAGDTLGAATGAMIRAAVTLIQGDTAAAAADLERISQYASATLLPYEVLGHTVKLCARASRVSAAQALLLKLQRQTTAVSNAARARILLARGEVLLARGDLTGGLDAVDRAAALDPTKDALESSAHAAAAAARYGLAAERYDSLAADRGLDWDGQAVLDLGAFEAAGAWERAGRPDLARQRYETFLAGWREGDSALPAVREAKRRLASLTSGLDSDSAGRSPS